MNETACSDEVWLRMEVHTPGLFLQVSVFKLQGASEPPAGWLQHCPDPPSVCISKPGFACLTNSQVTLVVQSLRTSTIDYMPTGRQLRLTKEG